MFYVYILESVKDGTKYVGVTINLRNRIKEHNLLETRSIKPKAPYRILWYSAFKDRSKAYDFEKYLKSSSGLAFRNKHLT